MSKTSIETAWSVENAKNDTEIKTPQTFRWLFLQSPLNLQLEQHYLTHIIIFILEMTNPIWVTSSPVRRSSSRRRHIHKCKPRWFLATEVFGLLVLLHGLTDERRGIGAHRVFVLDEANPRVVRLGPFHVLGRRYHLLPVSPVRKYQTVTGCLSEREELKMGNVEASEIVKDALYHVYFYRLHQLSRKRMICKFFYETRVAYFRPRPINP